MSTDSDGDTIPDVIESYYDSNDDGILDRYSLDSDGDTIPDGAERDADGNLLTYTSPEGLVTYCFRSRDCDGDGVPDNEEPNCGGVSGINRPDTDGDGYPDASEIAAGTYAIVHGLLDGRTISSVSDIVCNPNLTVKDVSIFVNDETVSVLGVGTDLKTIQCRFSRATNQGYRIYFFR